MRKIIIFKILDIIHFLLAFVFIGIFLALVIYNNKNEVALLYGYLSIISYILSLLWFALWKINKEQNENEKENEEKQKEN